MSWKVQKWKTKFWDKNLQFHKYWSIKRYPMEIKFNKIIFEIYDHKDEPHESVSLGSWLGNNFLDRLQIIERNGEKICTILFLSFRNDNFCYNNTIWHLYSALLRTQPFYITDMAHNWTMQLCGSSSISASCNIQTHRTGDTDWEHVALSWLISPIFKRTTGIANSQFNL